MSEHGDIPHVEPESSEDMVEDDLYNESDEVILAPQEPITRKDIRELVKSWEDKLDKMTEGMRALKMSTHDVHTHLDTVTRESHQGNTSAHAHSTSLAYHEHAYHTAGGTPKIPHRVLLLPCDPGHTNGSHTRRQGGNQSGNHARRRNWNDNEHQERKTNGPKFAFAPKMVRMNYLQDVSDNDYAEEEQNNDVGND